MLFAVFLLLAAHSAAALTEGHHQCGRPWPIQPHHRHRALQQKGPPPCHDCQCLQPEPLKNVDCDSPSVAGRFTAPLGMQILLTFRIMADDNGANPLLTRAQVEEEVAWANKRFADVGLNFTASYLIHNDTKRRRGGFVTTCKPDMVGNGKCDTGCYTYLTGWDGGDCPYPPGIGPSGCGKVGPDGVCDAQCNFREKEWDFGDCCKTRVPLGPSSACKDPRSPNRDWFNFYEYFPDSSGPDPTIRVTVVPFPEDVQAWAAVAFFPNAEGVDYRYPESGGIYALQGILGRGNTSSLRDILSHELGHSFGLFHVFHGVTEVDQVFTVTVKPPGGSQPKVMKVSDVSYGSTGGATGTLFFLPFCQEPPGDLKGRIVFMETCSYYSGDHFHPSLSNFSYNCHCAHSRPEMVKKIVSASAEGIVIVEKLPVSTSSSLGSGLQVNGPIPVRTMDWDEWQSMTSTAIETVTINPMNCTSPCFEVDSRRNTSGDYCDDTAPTPLNFACEDPTWKENCSGTGFRNTPFRNIMAYSSCAVSIDKEFTASQIRRMRCYLSRFYSDFQRLPVPIQSDHPPESSISGESPMDAAAFTSSVPLVLLLLVQLAHS